MSPYVWTDQPPRHEGRYWYRESVEHEPEVVVVFLDPSTEWCVRYRDDGDEDNEDFLQNWHGHWSTTPISPPREPVGNPFGA
jgi:hypothetical protein